MHISTIRRIRFGEEKVLIFKNNIIAMMLIFRFNSLISNNIDPFWCAKCLNYVECPHLHSVDGPHKEVLSPFCLLTPLQNDKGEAVSVLSHLLHQERSFFIFSVSCNLIS